MKVSLNTIKQYIDFELPPVAELVARINEQLGGVEEVIDLMTDRNIRHIPVVTEDGDIAGFLSIMELLAARKKAAA